LWDESIKELSLPRRRKAVLGRAGYIARSLHGRREIYEGESQKQLKMSQVLVATPAILAEVGRITVQGQPSQVFLNILTSKLTRAKWTGGVTQMIGHLLCKHKALSSNPSHTKQCKIISLVWWLTPVIPATQEVGIKVLGQLGQKVARPPSQPIKSLGRVHTCHFSYMGSLDRKMTGQASTRDLIQKIKAGQRLWFSGRMSP
jgi:hypothetical protein